MKLANLKIDVSKIDRDKLYQGKKGIYLNLTISILDGPDKYGNHIRAWEPQTKEEIEQKKEKKFMGDGKVFYESKPEEYNPDTLPYDQKEVKGPKLPWE